LSVVAVGCGTEEAADLEQVDLVQSALTNGGVWMGDASGRIYTTAGGTTYENISSSQIYTAMRSSGWPTKSPPRYNIIDWADWQNYQGLCGAPAHSRYGAAAGSKWCTEYSRWILRTAGLRNIRYCLTHFIGCLDYVYLSEADSVDDMVNLFSENGGWINQANITLSDIQPGDYLALTGSSGEKKSHSGIVMAVSSDGRHVYTSEGNVGDCVRFNRRDLFINGVLNSKINGLGKVNVAF
jgi:hypothetical protein